MTGTIRRVENFYLFRNDSSNPPTYYIDNGLDVSDDFGLQERDRLMELSDKEFISECIIVISAANK